MPNVGGVFVPRNPAFEAKHPRDRSGRDRGQFVDVVGLMHGLGASFDQESGAWMVPKDRSEDLKQAQQDMGFEMMSVPKGMRPLRSRGALASETDVETGEPDPRIAADANIEKQLAIPPAWTDVMVLENLAEPGDAKALAIGRDEKGRRQTIRNPLAAEKASADKFERIRRLDERIDAVDEHLLDDAPHDDTAAAMLLVRRMGLRPGSTKNTGAEQWAYGASTLERRHVRVEGDVVHLEFDSKKGGHTVLSHEDADLAAVLRTRLRGKAGDEQIFPKTNDRKMNSWVKQTAGDDFTVKDFRTYLGTSVAAALVMDSPEPMTAKEHRQLELRVADQVSQVLGNDRNEALKSYIDPAVFGASPGDAPSDADLPKPGEAAWPGHELDRIASEGIPSSREQAVANREAYARQGETEALVADMVARWTGGGHDLADTKDAFVADLEAGKYDKALDAMRNGSLTPELTDGPPLFRGIRAFDQASDDWIRNIKVGDTHDLRHFASFTETAHHAEAMAGLDTRVVFEVEPNGRGLNVSGISNTPTEREWFMAGKLEILEVVERKEIEPEDEGWPPGVQVHVRARHIDESDPPVVRSLDDVPGETGRSALKQAFDAGFTEGDDLGGNVGSEMVKRITLSDGSNGVLKRPRPDQHRREYVSGVVANAMGFDVHTIDAGEGRLLTNMVNGSPGGKKASIEDLRAHVTAPGGREIGVLDWLIRNRDRHGGNWIVTESGVVPIDHGLANFGPVDNDRDIPRGVFAEHWLGLTQKPTSYAGADKDAFQALSAKNSKAKLQPKVSKGYLGSVLTALEKARDEFSDVEWNGMTERLRILRTAAPDSIDGEEPFRGLR